MCKRSSQHILKNNLFAVLSGTRSTSPFRVSCIAAAFHHCVCKNENPGHLRGVLQQFQRLLAGGERKQPQVGDSRLKWLEVIHGSSGRAPSGWSSTAHGARVGGLRVGGVPQEGGFPPGFQRNAIRSNSVSRSCGTPSSLPRSHTREHLLHVHIFHVFLPDYVLTRGQLCKKLVK